MRILRAGMQMRSYFRGLNILGCSNECSHVCITATKGSNSFLVKLHFNMLYTNTRQRSMTKKVDKIIGVPYADNRATVSFEMAPLHSIGHAKFESRIGLRIFSSELDGV